jgi:hypothetical protein
MSQARVRGLRGRLETLHARQADLTPQLATDRHTTPDAAELTGLADQIEHTLASESPEQAKELLRQLIKEIRVHNRRRIVPIYRVPAAVRTMPSKVGGTGLKPMTSWLRHGLPIGARRGSVLPPARDQARREKFPRELLRISGLDLRYPAREPNLASARAVFKTGRPS